MEILKILIIYNLKRSLWWVVYRAVNEPQGEKGAGKEDKGTESPGTITGV